MECFPIHVLILGQGTEILLTYRSGSVTGASTFWASQYNSAITSVRISAVRSDSSSVLSTPPISIKLLFGEWDWLYSLLEPIEFLL